VTGRAEEGCEWPIYSKWPKRGIMHNIYKHLYYNLIKCFGVFLKAILLISFVCLNFEVLDIFGLKSRLLVFGGLFVSSRSI
jgi:hypothetical protein